MPSGYPGFIRTSFRYFIRYLFSSTSNMLQNLAANIQTSNMKKWSAIKIKFKTCCNLVCVYFHNEQAEFPSLSRFPKIFETNQILEVVILFKPRVTKAITWMHRIWWNVSIPTKVGAVVLDLGQTHYAWIIRRGRLPILHVAREMQIFLGKVLMYVMNLELKKINCLGNPGQVYWTVCIEKHK